MFIISTYDSEIMTSLTKSLVKITFCLIKMPFRKSLPNQRIIYGARVILVVKIVQLFEDYVNRFLEVFLDFLEFLSKTAKS